MASHTRASRQALPMDETTRTFGDAGASAAVSLDGFVIRFAYFSNFVAPYC